MEIYIIGKLIGEFRKRKKISQEELSFGICAVSTLSRIESGKQIPNRKTAEALLSKLGESVPGNFLVMSGSEVARLNLESKMTGMIAHGDYEIVELLREYESVGDMPVLEKQTYLFFKTIYDKRHGAESGNVLDAFCEALRLTIPDFRLETAAYPSLLTITELMLLNNISLVEYSMERKNEAIAIMEFLKSYFETKSVLSEDMSRNYPVILFNLSNWKGLAGFYEEAMELSELGIKVCAEFGKLAYYPYFIFNKGWCLCKLGKIPEGKWHLHNAFVSFAYLEKKDEMDDLLPQVNSDFNLNLSISDFTCPKEKIQ